VQLIVDLNGYLHDFTSALWIVGSILLLMMRRETRKPDVSDGTLVVLARLARTIRRISVPALVITLCTGGVRAATFAHYEHPGEVTRSIIVMLIVKHVIFTAVIAWGVWIHLKSRSISTDRSLESS
jgi:hypothetical protein